MTTQNSTKLYGLIGNPIGHSLSPFIHSFFAEHTGQNMIYLPFNIESRLKEVICGAYAMKIAGFNITTPYKNEVMKYLPLKDDSAARCRCCNTLVYTDKGYKAYNTDLNGVLKTLDSFGVRNGCGTIAVLGAGAAASAAAFAALSLNPERILIANRTFKNALCLAERIKAYSSKACEAVCYENLSGIKRMDAVIQCSSAGFGGDTVSPASDLSFLANTALAVELIYYPRETKFLRTAKNFGIKTANGLWHLAFQAAGSFELWTGETISDTLIRDLIELLTKLP